jgi:hypothetical protein
LHELASHKDLSFFSMSFFLPHIWPFIHVWGFFSSSIRLFTIGKDLFSCITTEVEFINIQFCWGFWA